MRAGIDAAWTAALAAEGIVTGIMARLDFASETVCVWTGTHPITVTGTGDTMLDGRTFEPLVAGVMLSIGDNAFSYQGSEALTLTLAIPATPHSAIAAASVIPDEYQSRLAVMWRAVMVTPPGSTTAPIWSFRRVRAGSMDSVAIANDGDRHTFSLVIEAHAALISSATQSTYLDQPLIDPADTSQAYAVAIANGAPAPGRAAAGGTGGGGGGAGGGGSANRSGEFERYVSY